MFTLRRLFAFLAVAGFVLGGVSHARAQSIALSVQGVKHKRMNRGGNLTNSQINYADCASDDVMTFPVSLTAYGTNHIEAWAGQGCDNHDTRLSTTILNCWKVASVVPVSNTPDPLEISVRTILYGRTTISGNTNSAIDLTGTGGAGTAGSGGGSATAGGDSTADAAAGANPSAETGGTAGTSSGGSAAAGDPCTDKVTETGAQNIVVFFMLVDGSNNTVGNVAQWQGTFKLQAPAPPDNIKAGVGENLIPLSFSYSSTNSDMSINGFNLYCDPAPGHAVAADAGLLPVDGGPEPTCGESLVLKQGANATDLSAHACGSAGKSSTRANATNLVDGVAYNVAIATTDSFSNVGVLSKVVCQVPQPVTGFFEAYTDAGGKGGGGFCSFSRRRETLTLFALLGCASCLFLRRRRAA